MIAKKYWEKYFALLSYKTEMKKQWNVDEVFLNLI